MHSYIRACTARDYSESGRHSVKIHATLKGINVT